MSCIQVLSRFTRQTLEFPYAQVPIIEVDGKTLAQSHAILRYLATKFGEFRCKFCVVQSCSGMAGKDEWETAKLDEISELVAEFNNQCLEYICVKLGYSPGDKVHATNKLV